MEINIKRKRISSTALISFTDIIFLLIIFLLIASSFVTHSGIQVKLPSSVSRQNEFNKNISLTLTIDNEVYIDNEYTTWEKLPKILNRKLIEDPEMVIVIRADEDVALKNIVDLLDVAQLSGSNRFFIATQLLQQE